MNLEEFHRIRKPFFIHPDTLLVIFPAQKHMNVSHAQWFTEMSYVYVHTIRGYYWKDEEDEYIMMYWNDFEIPNVNASIFAYLFVISLLLNGLVWDVIKEKMVKFGNLN